MSQRFVVLHLSDIERVGGPGELAVWACLCDHVQGSRYCGATVHPGISRICEWTKIKSDRTVRKYLSSLEKLGMIQIEERRDGDRQTTNTYRLLGTPQDLRGTPQNLRGGGGKICGDGGAKFTDKEELNEQEPDEQEITPLIPLRGRPSRWDSEYHLGKLKELAGVIGCPTWTKITSARKAKVKRRFKEESSSSWEEFYEHVMAVAGKVHQTQWEEPWWNLEVFLRVPQRGNPDHFLRAAEGHYGAPVDRKPQMESYINGNGVRQWREKTVERPDTEFERKVRAGINNLYQVLVLKRFGVDRMNLEPDIAREVKRRWDDGDRGDRR